MLKVLAMLAFGYLLGSVPSGWLVMKVYRNQDLRKLGSGNIGAANVFRAGGPGAFALTLIADGMKGFIPIMVAILFGLGDNEIALAAIGPKRSAVLRLRTTSMKFCMCRSLPLNLTPVQSVPGRGL